MYIKKNLFHSLFRNIAFFYIYNGIFFYNTLTVHQILFGFYAITLFINSFFMIKGIVDFAKSIQMEIQNTLHKVKRSFYNALYRMCMNGYDYS